MPFGKEQYYCEYLKKKEKLKSIFFYFELQLGTPINFYRTFDQMKI